MTTRPYVLELTHTDVHTIAFVGTRYAWSQALLTLEAGENVFTEPEAWELAAAFDSDAEGGHALFPLLDPISELHAKLLAFREAIV